jgi:octaprenyl-diphosphate synthase
MSSQRLLSRQAEQDGVSLSALYDPVARELQEAESIFRHELGSRFPFVQHLVNRCSAFRGKQLRPGLVLLSGRACGTLRPAHPVLAAVVEMIHTATLVHDDVLDEAALRRHSATINAEWGNETAVLLGDYLFTHAFHLAASLDSTLACRWIGRATNLVCEGEMLQIHHRGNFDLGEEDYFAIIRGKTAELTAVACRLGAHYAGGSEAEVRGLERFGRDLGVAFQIADDVLDLWGEEKATGKSLGTDLEKQKLTLPLIRLLATAPAETAATIRRLLAQATPQHRRELRPYLEASGALEYARDHARRLAADALAALDILSESNAKETLRALAHFVVRRCGGR